MSTQSFADLGVSTTVVSALARRDITTPFAVQRLVIGDVLGGRDVLVRSPTGSGKTLAFGVPLVERIDSTDPRPTGLIIAPTRELVSQIADDLYPIAHARALRVTAVYGGVGINKQARDAARSHILVATPGRLEDLLARRAFRLDEVRVLVLDEADRMLDMGFRPAVDRIVRQCPAERQTLFFSATLDGESGKLARAYTTDPASHEHVPAPSATAAAISHRFVTVAHDDRLAALVQHLEGVDGLSIVFVRTKRGADRLTKRLGAAGVAAVAMHGDKSQGQRERALSRFESGAVRTLVATDVAARGIDVAGITQVINFDAPADSDTYTHRVGRTGRAGRSGSGITFVTPEQRRDLAKLADELGLDHELHGGRSGARHHATTPARGSRGTGANRRRRRPRAR
jgi:superfamily II DNA/RNA helicase